jgi:electron transport complex protein RnfG
VICATVLAFFYTFTAPLIAETRANLALAGLKEVTEADSFAEIIADTLWFAINTDGNTIGIVFRVWPQGYGGLIPITVGLGADNKITGIRIAGASEGLKETPGLGVKVTEEEFRGQFIGKTADQVKLRKDGGMIDGITAATISSRAVCEGIRKGMEKYFGYCVPAFDKRKLFSECDAFIEVIKDSLWFAVKGSDTLGIVFYGNGKGYLDRIGIAVGVDRKNNIVGVDILCSQETEGIGEQIRDQEFLQKFREGKPETISGATVSSKAVIMTVHEYMEKYKGYLK